MYLPPECTWFNYQTKQVETFTIKEMAMQDSEQAIYVKAGTILPILLHQNALALLRAISNPIMLEVYVNNNKKAAGLLYMDDGESFNHEDG